MADLGSFFGETSYGPGFREYLYFSTNTHTHAHEHVCAHTLL